MNPFPTRQAAEQYLARIPDPVQREATRARLGLTPPSPAPVQAVQNVDTLPPPRPNARPTACKASALPLSLPWTPSINHYWRHVLVPCKPARPGAPPYRVQVLISKEGREYRRAVDTLIRNLGRPAAPPEARLLVALTLHAPTRRTIDIDNRIKAALDALTHAQVWADDSLIDRLTVDRGEVTPGGRVDVVITPLTNTLFGGQP